MVGSLQAVAQNRILLSSSLKRFLLINLGEAEDKRYQLFEPEGRVLISPGASPRFIKKRFRTSEKGFGQQPLYTKRRGASASAAPLWWGCGEVTQWWI
jgi:hypothetical protein